MKSEGLFNESKKYFPGGVNSPVRAFKPYPFFVEKAKGQYIWDVDGQKYIDYCLAYGPMVMGHANEEIIDNVYTQLEKGTGYGAPTENELKLAKKIVEYVPCADMVRFVNSGTEATMSAIRLARGITGKNKIIKFEGSYHGAHDYVLVKSGSGAACLPDSEGVPKDTTKNTLSCPYNDVDALTKLIGSEEDIAAIIVEPVMGNIGCILPQDGYLKFLREISYENDIILIFDEVITGFRLAQGGAQEYFDVTPDLVTLGKIVGGGFPMGVLAGKKEFMKQIAPQGNVYQAGTFNGNPISVIAGLTTLNLLKYSFYNTLNGKGQYMRAGLEQIVEDLKLDIQVVGLASMFQLYFTENEVKNYIDAKKSDVDKFDMYFHNLLTNGVFMPPSQFESCFISQAHTYDDLDRTLDVIENILNEIF